MYQLTEAKSDKSKQFDWFKKYTSISSISSISSLLKLNLLFTSVIQCQLKFLGHIMRMDKDEFIDI